MKNPERRLKKEEWDRFEVLLLAWTVENTMFIQETIRKGQFLDISVYKFC